MIKTQNRPYIKKLRIDEKPDSMKNSLLISIGGLFAIKRKNNIAIRCGLIIEGVYRSLDS